MWAKNRSCENIGSYFGFVKSQITFQLLKNPTSCFFEAFLGGCVDISTGEVLQHRQTSDGTATVIEVIRKDCCRVLFRSSRGEYNGTINPKHLLAVYKRSTIKN